MDWERVMDRLSSFYGCGDWRVPYLRDHAEDPFQVLIGTVLSQRTRDEATDVASSRLFARYPDPGSLARAPRARVERLIHGTGFYRVKSRAIRQIAQEILDRFHGEVPRTLEELTSLPGVGPKTANCVLVFGYGIPAIPVDTHVHRISNRLGIVRTRTPEETERRLRQVVDRRYWIPLNPLLVQHGQNLCRPISPRCPECPIRNDCATGRALATGRPPPRAQDRPQRRPRPSATSAGAGGLRGAPRGGGASSPRAPARRTSTRSPRGPTRTRTRSPPSRRAGSN
ncbi:MAG: hypothetical protein HKL79_00415 [Thermoplasmata archaeon]|nr:hypothetical protein [Thermoplasmata archaeon]